MRVLEQVGTRRGYVEDLLADALPRLSPADRGLCQELVYGVVRWQGALDWLIARRTEGREQKHTVQNLLRLGLYQLLWLDRVPNHAAVFETVELAREAGFGPQSGFVNALLRSYSGAREATRAQLEELKRQDPAAGWSHPAWLVGRWMARWGGAECQALLEWNNRAAEVYARVNSLRADAGKVLEHWRLREGVSYDFVRAPWLEDNLVFKLREHPLLVGMESFVQGWFYVQDPSTLMAVRLLDPQRGDKVLDLCAAPGGKTTYIAQCMQNEGQIVASDDSPQRLKRLAENCRRLGVTCVTTAGPGASGSPGFAAEFDRILVDAPCSNTGVIRRRVELRWRVTAPEIQRLQQSQLKLLDQAAARLRPGGVLVYSTCSLEPEENTEVVTGFLAAHPEFTKDAERELLPFRDGVDGAFAARLRKNG